MSPVTQIDASGVPVRIYRPDRPRGDALLWLHGGGFSGGDLRMPEADWVATTLAARGHLVVTADYRLATDTVRFPAPSDDVLIAWAWLRRNAAELGAPRSAHLGGASAGGNLALGAALRLRDGDPVAGATRPPDTIVLAYPTLHAVQPAPSAALAALLEQLPAGQRSEPDYVTAMYTRFIREPLDRAPAAAIPGVVAPDGLPPVMIVASEIDGLRPSAQAYAELLSAHGIEHEYIVEPGVRHGHLNQPDEPAALTTLDRFSRWLDAHS
ncbi:alpha/beta hydrolase [Pseudolysinimonas kribbensis]